MFEIKRALVLAPHTDDGELGSGGTITRLVERGVAVHYVALSICEASVPPGFPSDILATEVKHATQALGIAPDNLLIHRYPVRCLAVHRQEILEQLVALRQQLRPDLVLLPSTEDIHQDHQVLAQEGIRAFKNTTLLGYEFPWNTIRFSADALISLKDHHLDRKLDALRQYKSQMHRSYLSEDLIRGLASVRGQQAGTKYAEAFQVIRWVIR